MVALLLEQIVESLCQGCRSHVCRLVNFLAAAFPFISLSSAALRFTPIPRKLRFHHYRRWVTEPRRMLEPSHFGRKEDGDPMSRLIQY
jgi:hypothetical protein